MNKEVKIFRYITEGSFDAYSWQLLETKQRFITDLLSGTIAGRSGSEVDDTVLDYAEVKALALGNPLLKSRVNTRNELSRMAALRRQGLESRLRLEKRYRELPDEISAKKHECDTCKADADFVRSTGPNLFKGLNIRRKKELAEYRKYIRDNLASKLYGYVDMKQDWSLFDYRGFMIVLPAGMDAENPYLYLVREGKYRVDMSDKETGLLIRIDNYIDKLDGRCLMLERQLEILRQELAETEAELMKSDNYSDVMAALTEKLEQIDKELGVNELKGQIS